MNIKNRQIERRLAKLDALEAGGVDNWDWYDESLKDWHKENELDERADILLENLCEILACSAYEPSERGGGVAFDDKAMEQARDIILVALKEQSK